MSSAPAWTISRRLASGRSEKASTIEVAGQSSWMAARRRRPERLASDGPAKSTVNGPSCMQHVTDGADPVARHDFGAGVDGLDRLPDGLRQVGGTFEDEDLRVHVSP